MAHPPVAGKFGKGYFGDQFRRNPMGIPALRFRDVGWRCLACQLTHLACQLFHHLFGKAGPDPALVDEAIALVLGKQQRSKRTCLLVRLAPANDHKLLPPRAFYLQPGSGTPTVIGCIGALRDDALLSRLAHRIQQFLTPTDQVIGKANAVLAFSEDRVQSFLALNVG